MMLRRDRAMTAVAIVLDVALNAGRAGTVSAAEIGERLCQTRRGIEPVLQALTRANLLDSVRGPSGGYRLARPARALPLAEIARAVESRTPEGRDSEAETPAGTLHAAVLSPLWDEMEGLLVQHLGGLTIEDLVKRAAAKGITRRPSEPLNFAI